MGMMDGRASAVVVKDESKADDAHGVAVATRVADGRARADVSNGADIRPPAGWEVSRWR